MLAIVVLTVTAGAAVASDLNAAGGGDHGAFGREHHTQEVTSQELTSQELTSQEVTSQEVTSQELTSQELTSQATAAGSTIDASAGTQVDGVQVDVLGNSIDVVVADSSSSDGTGGVTGSGAGTPSASGEAPAAAASGPAPDAAAAAPDPAPVAHTFAAAAVVGTSGAAVSDGFGAVVHEAAPVAPTHALEGLDDRPTLDSTGSTGTIADQVTDAPSAARALVSTERGRPLAAIGALLMAIALFVGVHRRADWGDRKLAAARSGPEVARFR